VREPQTPAELRDAFLKCFDEVDTAVIEAVDELIDRLESAYCGETELTKVEFLLGRTLFQMMSDGDSVI